MACWVAELIAHTELAPPGGGEGGTPFPWGTRPVWFPVRTLPGRSRPRALPARLERSTCCRASPAPPARLIYAAPHFLLVSMPLSPLPPFFFFFPLVLSVHCLASFFFFYFFSYCSQAFPLSQQAAIFGASLLVCLQNGVLSTQSEGPCSPSPRWNVIPGAARELFLFFFYFIVAKHKPSIPVTDAPGPWLQQNWWGGRRRPSPPSRRCCRAQRRPSVPSCAAPACRLLAAVAGLAQCLRGREGLYLKTNKQKKKFHFCFVCPHFICIT